MNVKQIALLCDVALQTHMITRLQKWSGSLYNGLLLVYVHVG